MGEVVRFILVKPVRSLLLAFVLASCTPAPTDRVDAAAYDAFWLWAGVKPQPVLKSAKTIYLLAGEVRRDSGRFVSLRPGTPHLSVPELWLVVRVDTLEWKAETAGEILAELNKWQAAGNRLAGVQIDFDARTRQLESYAEFLRAFRARLPDGARLSVTGLLDWSANGDPNALQALGGTVDEIVIQTYQRRRTIPGYETYFDRIKELRIPYKVGLVQGGEWKEPTDLRNQRSFRGYVIFLVNQP